MPAERKAGEKIESPEMPRKASGERNSDVRPDSIAGQLSHTERSVPVVPARKIRDTIAEKVRNLLAELSVIDL
jgi:hypothetical protein